MQTNLFQSLSSARQILEGLKLKLSPLTLPSSNLIKRPKNDENQSFLANKAHPPTNTIKVSDQMEIHWLKSTIDRLCKDNSLLYQDINEIMRVVEVLGLKYKEIRDGKMGNVFVKNNDEIKLLRQKLENEQTVNSKLRQIISQMKSKYERLIEALKNYAEEEVLERLEDEKLIGRLSEENEYLRKMLRLTCDEDSLNKFANEMREKEQQYKFIKSFEKQKETEPSFEEMKERIKGNEEPNWEKDYKDLNEMCEKLIKDKKNTEANQQMMNEINEELEDFDEFENFEQFLKTFKTKNKSEIHHYKNLEIPNNPGDFVSGIEEKVSKSKGFHKKSKTNTEVLDVGKTNNKFYRYLKKFSIDDTFL